MIKSLFTTDLYIKVKNNQFEAKCLSSSSRWESARPAKPFSTERLLVGTFSAAEPALKSLVKKVTPRGIIKKSPRVIIQPLEYLEGGLSEVEERVLKELALSAGAFKVVLHTGEELTDADASTLLDRK
ncbi:hypothetical protein [Gilvimarinus agarilyticus]|uniref:hypothetical protein n=1 Tax=Gilvimarinus agarilyticus TaxID=679259 RepID=UPI000697E3DD|nr:hypothetical protein [Gilvimarinus agarilyticus]